MYLCVVGGGGGGFFLGGGRGRGFNPQLLGTSYTLIKPIHSSI